MFNESVEADLIAFAGQVDLVGRVDPGLQFHGTELVIERVEDHVECTRDGVDTTRLPACRPVTADCDEEPSIMILVEQLIRALFNHTIHHG